MITRTVAALTAAVGVCLPSANADEFYDQVYSQRVPETALSTVSYWTDDRMRDARPVPIGQRSVDPSGAQIRSEVVSSGPTVLVQSRMPGDPYLGRRVERSDSTETTATVEPLAGSFPFSFTSNQTFPNIQKLYQKYPYKVVGRVFFTIPGTGDFVCSGSIVSAPNNSVVWTAGHCVYTPGVGFHTNFLFAPAAHEGANPFGVWTANTLGTTQGWAQGGQFEYDMGGAFMNPGGSGSGNFQVGQLGSLGFMADAPRRQHWHLRGYPAEPPFDGEHHHTCAAGWSWNDLPSGDSTLPATIGVGCDMTGGSSGGPWIVDFSGEAGGTTNLLNGNVSYGYTGVPDQLYGPYFGVGAVNLHDYLGNL